MDKLTEALAAQLREYEEAEERGELVRVVRCKDCVHCHSLTEYPMKSVFYSCAIWGRSDLSGNCYCAYGESREAALKEQYT